MIVFEFIWLELTLLQRSSIPIPSLSSEEADFTVLIVFFSTIDFVRAGTLTSIAYAIAP